VMDENSQRQMLVLTDRVKHAQTILDMLSDNWKLKTAILSQKLSAVKRNIACNTMSILIGTYSMCKEGFDQPTLNTLLMATPRPDIDQIVGRIMRVEKSVRVTHPLIVDIVDPQFRRQHQARLELYKKRMYAITTMEI